MARAIPLDTGARRTRDLMTPEGLALPLQLASRGARAGALLLDLMILYLSLTIFILGLAALGLGVAQLNLDHPNPAVELIIVILILTVFLSRFGYFLWFELGPRGATLGKRIVGIRVAARDGGRLTAEAVIARNLMRDVEVFVPLFLLLGGASSIGIAGWAAGVWLAIFVLFPCFNHDSLRAGDLIAGTWVVEAERRKLMPALSIAGSTGAPATAYRFGEAELSVYGERELQALEDVLRQASPEAQREVVETICRKIGWEAGRGDEREFLEAFYAALRARLERNMRFGRRKKDKFA